MSGADDAKEELAQRHRKENKDLQGRRIRFAILESIHLLKDCSADQLLWRKETSMGDNRPLSSSVHPSRRRPGLYMFKISI